VIIRLQLRHEPSSNAVATAWFLPGDSAEAWLTDLGECGLADSSTRLFIVPRSMSDRKPAGALVVPSGGTSPSRRPRGIPCRVIADRLYLPAQAVLFPPVTDAEVRALCPLPLSFFHPALGLSGFEKESTLRIWDLLESPNPRAEEWSFAQAGSPNLSELRVISLSAPPSIEDIFGEAKEQIGTEPPTDLPPAPDEPANDSLTKSTRTFLQGIAKGLAEAMRRLPHTAQRRTWVNKVEDWANRQLQGINEQLDKIRHKQLRRLLHLFDSDPEAALRHAIPMNAFAHRGVAPPGGDLGSHSPNFDLSRLGGQPTDFWHVPPELQEVLRRRYREMADREMQLGRYRRAAYIYAELLGDLVSAANALKQGKHFREAAILYEEHLKNPLEAARCLAEGGLLPEAIDRYQKLSRWLDVAELYERMGDHASATIFVRRMVEERVKEDDILGAAKLVEERLQDIEGALSLLLSAWPASRQASLCMASAFQLLARLGRHEKAMECVSQIAREQGPALPMLDALSGPVRGYPHEQVRHRAADLSRVLIARDLGKPTLSPDHAKHLTEYLVQLAPEDRLLVRDANRYLAVKRESAMRARRVTPPPLPGMKPLMLRRFELPRQIEWVALRSQWHWFYALGVTANRLTVVRGIWDGEFQSLSSDCSMQSVKSGFLFEPTGEREGSVLLKVSGGVEFRTRHFPALDSFFNATCVIETAAWLKPQHWPAALGDQTIWTAHVAAGRAVLSCHDMKGTLQRTLDVTADLLDDSERGEHTHLCLAVTANRPAIALGNRLLVMRGNGSLQRIDLPAQVTHLIPTLPHTRAGVAILLEHGAAMHWAGASDVIELDRDIVSSHGAFVPGGPLALISTTGLVLFDVGSVGVQSVTRAELPRQRSVGICATSSVNQFAILGVHGEITVYGVPR
jgi:tetratricopeptide (TPR) repeat protein